MIPVLVLDPGHPSRPSDRGVVADDFIEADWTMHVALLVKDALRWLPVAVELTRHAQRPVGLRARGQLSTHKFQADLVISIHANANKDPRVHGMTTFHKEGDGRAKDIAEHIARTFDRHGQYATQRGRLGERSGKSFACSKGHEYWSRAFNVLEHHEAPAVLLEAGFATNIADRKFLQSQTGQQLFAASVVHGVAHWLHTFPAKAVV